MLCLIVFSISRKQLTAKLIVIGLFMLRVLVGIVFWLSDRSRLVKIYYAVRIVLVSLVIFPCIAAFVLKNYLSILHASIPSIILFIQEITVYCLSFKILGQNYNKEQLKIIERIKRLKIKKQVSDLDTSHAMIKEESVHDTSEGENKMHLNAFRIRETS